MIIPLQLALRRQHPNLRVWRWCSAMDSCEQAWWQLPGLLGHWLQEKRLGELGRFALEKKAMKEQLITASTH